MGAEVADAIEWSASRLLCIAGDFTKYDEHAIQQIPRNIELIRYRRYGDDFLLLELVNATAGATAETAPGVETGSTGGGGKKTSGKTVSDRIEQAPQDVGIDTNHSER